MLSRPGGAGGNAVWGGKRRVPRPRRRGHVFASAWRRRRRHGTRRCSHGREGRVSTPFPGKGLGAMPSSVWARLCPGMATQTTPWHPTMLSRPGGIREHAVSGKRVGCHALVGVGMSWRRHGDADDAMAPVTRGDYRSEHRKPVRSPERDDLELGAGGEIDVRLEAYLVVLAGYPVSCVLVVGQREGPIFPLRTFGYRHFERRRPTGDLEGDGHVRRNGRGAAGRQADQGRPLRKDDAGRRRPAAAEAVLGREHAGRAGDRAVRPRVGLDPGRWGRWSGPWQRSAAWR